MRTNILNIDFKLTKLTTETHQDQCIYTTYIGKECVRNDCEGNDCVLVFKRNDIMTEDRLTMTLDSATYKTIRIEYSISDCRLVYGRHPDVLEITLEVVEKGLRKRTISAALHYHVFPTQDLEESEILQREQKTLDVVLNQRPHIDIYRWKPGFDVYYITEATVWDNTEFKLIAKIDYGIFLPPFRLPSMKQREYIVQLSKPIQFTLYRKIKDREFRQVINNPNKKTDQFMTTFQNELDAIQYPTLRPTQPLNYDILIHELTNIMVEALPKFTNLTMRIEYTDMTQKGEISTWVVDRVTKNTLSSRASPYQSALSKRRPKRSARKAKYQRTDRQVKTDTGPKRVYVHNGVDCVKYLKKNNTYGYMPLRK